jgi:hypothetical protein
MPARCAPCRRTEAGTGTGARRTRRWPLAVAACALLAGAAGCGSSSGASQEQVDQARREGAAQQKLKDQQAQLRKDIEALKKEREASRSSSSSSSGSTRPAASTSSGSSSPAPAPSSATGCGQGVSAGANTSCAFAINVARAYYQSGGGSPTLSVFSPVTNQTYTMQCTGGAPTTCRGGNNAVVYIR